MDRVTLLVMFGLNTPPGRQTGRPTGATLTSSRSRCHRPLVCAFSGGFRRAMTLVEVMVSFAVLVIVSAGILGAIVLAARIQERSRLRVEAFNVAGFIADQIRGAGLGKLATGAVGGTGSDISIQLPPSVAPSYSGSLTLDPALTSFALYQPLKITAQGTTFGGKTADIRSSTDNYAELWSKVSGATKVNLLYTDVRTQDVVNLGDSRYQLTKPWVNGRDTSGGLFRTYVVVMVTQNVHTNLNGTAFTDYLIRVDVAFDPAQMPGNQSITATARAYMTPDVLTRPNVLFVK